MQLKKWQIITAIAAPAILVLGAMWLLENSSDEVCSGNGGDVQCVPDKKCTTQNDAIVSCTKHE